LVVVVSASSTQIAGINASGDVLFSGLPNAVAGDLGWNVERSLAVSIDHEDVSQAPSFQLSERFHTVRIEAACSVGEPG